MAMFYSFKQQVLLLSQHSGHTSGAGVGTDVTEATAMLQN